MFLLPPPPTPPQPCPHPHSQLLGPHLLVPEAGSLGPAARREGSFSKEHWPGQARWRRARHTLEQVGVPATLAQEWKTPLGPQQQA